MREYDCGRRYGPELAQPVRSAVDHDAGSSVADKQCAVLPMIAGSAFDLAARAEKRQFNIAELRFHPSQTFSLTGRSGQADRDACDAISAPVRACSDAQADRD